MDANQAWNIQGLARPRTRSTVPLLADERVFSPHDMQLAAADVVSCKLVKHGRLMGLQKLAAIAEAACTGQYGGCQLQSPVGAAAHLHPLIGLRSHAPRQASPGDRLIAL